MYEGVSGGPCPVCGRSGTLLTHYGEFGGTRVIIHMIDDSDCVVERCEVPEVDGIMFTKGGRWWYKPITQEHVP